MTAARLCCLPILPRPIPLIPDEFSHLLVAGTLAEGRFANPVHPLWPHFETLFVLQRPAYASAYPPLQGALLAAGLVLYGDPWAGVLASMAALCVAIGWMLRAYVPPSWALYGALLAGAGFCILSYWANSYWGGAGAAIGGALVFGSLPRILSSTNRRDFALLGLGLCMLANSRPYEGFLASVPVAFVLVRHFSSTQHRRTALRTQAPVLACVLGAGAALTGLYNWLVTGNPFRLPHTAYIEQYAAAPAFVWQSPRKIPNYRDRVLRDAHVSFGIGYSEYATVSGAARMSWRKLSQTAIFYWGPLWPLVLIALPEFVRERHFRIALISTALCLTGILMTVFSHAHYAAPCTSVFVLLLVDACRRVFAQYRRVGTALVIAAPVAWIAWQAWELRRPASPNSLSYRPAMENQLTAEPGRHVVFVRYGALHPLGEEWVYNKPDIDRSNVVWARDLGQQANREVVEYYRDRIFWVLEPDHAFPRLSRCAPACADSEPAASN